MEVPKDQHPPLKRQQSLMDVKADASKLSPLWQKLIAEEASGAAPTTLPLSPCDSANRRPAPSLAWPRRARARHRDH